jgi:MoaA/NifB/PqqE/SkfB family radical SAM enzyme
VAWEITRSCNLACAHCRAAAHCAPYPGELSLDECKAVIDDIASITDPILILTGGEPLMRSDIWDIIDYAFEKGLHPVIGTNGTHDRPGDGAEDSRARHPESQRIAGFPHAAGPGCVPRRGRARSTQTIQGIANLREHGVNVQVNSTITKANRESGGEICTTLAEDAGASDFHPFLLVPTGRGEDLVDVELSPQEYEEVLTWAYERQKTSPMNFKPTDAPQYFRILHQRAAAEGVKLTGPLAHSRGCLGGISFAFISHVGDVQPCGYFDMQLGNVREKPFSQIWTSRPSSTTCAITTG